MVEGIGSVTEVVEQKIMGPNRQEIIRKIPGRLQYNKITLKRGLTSNMDLANWRNKVENGYYSEARSNGNIVMFDAAMNEVAEWKLENACHLN